MSRIGKKPIQLPQDVTLELSGKTLTVKGSKGTLVSDISDRIYVVVEDSKVLVTPKDTKMDSAIWGTTRANIANMIVGVSSGWSKTLELQGVGFRMELKEKTLIMRLGFSHPVEYLVPKGIDASIENNTLTISGVDRQVVGQVASEIRSFKKPEPYKGKGFRYNDEIVRRKAGKAAKSE